MGRPPGRPIDLKCVPGDVPRDVPRDVPGDTLYIETVNLSEHQGICNDRFSKLLGKVWGRGRPENKINSDKGDRQESSTALPLIPGLCLPFPRGNGMLQAEKS